MAHLESIAKLRKILTLEASRGYDNQSVFGGLDKVLPSWQSEALADGISEGSIEAISTRLRDYPRLSVSSRKDALDGVLRRLEREDAGVGNSPGDASEEEAPASLSAGEAHESLQDAEKAMPDSGARPAWMDSQQDQNTSSETDEDGSEDSLPAEVGAELDKGGQAEPIDEARVWPDSGERSPAMRPSPDLGRLADQPAALDAPLTVLHGVGERHAHTLDRLGLHSLGDLLYYLPRRYDDYTRLKTINRLWYGEEVTVVGTVQTASTRVIPGRKLTISEAVISDGSGALRVTWFNQPWISKSLKKDSSVVLSGKVDQYLGRLSMNNPEWEPLEKENLHTNRIVPVYPLTARITQRWLRRLMFQVVTYWAPRLQDPLPTDLRTSAGLMPLPEAVAQVHFPSSLEKLKAGRDRLAFDEILLLQMGLLQQKRDWQRLPGRAFESEDAWFSGLVASLPYILTEAQQKAVEDIRSDLRSGRPMNRLLQGDVGSGKTVVAALGISIVVAAGAQAAIMAPSGILAEQHYLTLTDLLSEAFSVLERAEIRLLLGDTPESEKREIRQGLAEGWIKLVIGTHALIEDAIEFQDLGLVIIDEQHRFGVKQRAALREKGTNPHLLVMTATPIPRSLALTVYGDLDLTLIDELPPGRLPVETHVLIPRERERVYSLIKTQIQEGRQAFIIYPLVEEDGGDESKAAVEEYHRLQGEIFPHLNLGLLHGRMKREEKESVMAGFRDNQTQVLVSTSVVEVGIDVPNASVMVIEGANRFGLAQLHQFRGRVGRGSENSYCLLIPENDEAAENARLTAMTETTDGFVLAEKDLEQRGPGDFLGTRQSGYAELKLARLTDVRMIEKARRFAQEVFDQDPDLQKPQYSGLRQAVDRFWSDGKGDVS